MKKNAAPQNRQTDVKRKNRPESATANTTGVLTFAAADESVQKTEQHESAYAPVHTQKLLFLVSLY